MSCYILIVSYINLIQLQESSLSKRYVTHDATYDCYFDFMLLNFIITINISSHPYILVFGLPLYYAKPANELTTDPFITFSIFQNLWL